MLILVAVLHNSKLFLCWGGARLCIPVGACLTCGSCYVRLIVIFLAIFFPDLVTNQCSLWILCDYFSVTLNYLT